jgi:hypothetical protein
MSGVLFLAACAYYMGVSDCIEAFKKTINRSHFSLEASCFSTNPIYVGK